MSAPIIPAIEALTHDATPVAFSSLNLDARLARAIGDLSFTQTTAVQSAVYPAVLARQDLVACAQTGTGKTVAFLLPLLQRLLSSSARPPGRPQPRVLILAPTRELAVQIEGDVRALVRYTGLRGVTACGGLPIGQQVRAFRAGVDIVVATPGRMLDHIDSGAATFEALDALVLDEADRMLDMGFWGDVMRIVETLPQSRQTLLFSATTSQDVVKASKQIMRAPKLIQVGRAGGLATSITHVSHVMPTAAKAAWLNAFLHRAEGQSLVFVRMKHHADRLAKKLGDDGHRTASLHANRTQGQRMSAIRDFKDGRVKVLVATDIAARGIDVEGIGQVINFDVPATPETYIHRVGRTGRAKASGTAVTLMAPDEVGAMRAIERSLNLRIDRPAI